jgi:rRNA maturation RNase YbeY
LVIQFDYSHDRFKKFSEALVTTWINNAIESEKKICGKIYYSFITEDEILMINREHLKHDYYTDIITFDTSFINIINGDIFISPDTIASNSEKLALNPDKEFYRVIIHGIMHLCGYGDANSKEKEIMRAREEKYLSYLEKI